MEIDKSPLGDATVGAVGTVALRMNAPIINSGT
jgi:hypothetical protein